jgi:hypothetical protein
LRAVRSLVVTVACTLLVMMGAAPAVAASATARHRVHGTLLLTRREHWRAASNGCVGAGIYDDVGSATRVVVLDQSGALLARTRLSTGHASDAGCRLRFTVTLPAGREYTFKVGRSGSVFQTTYDEEALAYARNRVIFEV